MARDEAFELKWHGEEILAALSGATFEGMELAAEHLLQVSTQLVPLEEGELQRSGTVTTDEAEEIVAVSYDTPYAVRQHEELTWRHDEGRQAKYLEEPMHTEQETMLRIIAQKAKQVID